LCDREHIGDLRADLDRVQPRQRALGQVAGENDAVQQFHHHVGDRRAIVQGCVTVLVDARHAGVAHPVGDDRLAPDPLLGPGVAGQRRVEHLDGDVPINQCVQRLVHDRDASVADGAEEHVPAEERRAPLKARHDG
jgi:hypothetical protein